MTNERWSAQVLTAVRRCWESAKGRSEPRNTVGRQAKCPLATQRSPLCFSPGCESARGISFASSRCPLAAAAFSPPERPASSSISMLTRCSSSFSIERSLVSPKRHRDAIIESAEKAGIKVDLEFRREFTARICWDVIRIAHSTHEMQRMRGSISAPRLSLYSDSSAKPDRPA